jgi:hypothetical protein
MRTLSKYNVKHQFEDLELVKMAHKRNYAADNQIVTCYSINCNGRTLLIGADYNHSKRADMDIHTAACDGNVIVHEGWGINKDATKEQLIKSAQEQLAVVLNAIIPD